MAKFGDYVDISIVDPGDWSVGIPDVVFTVEKAFDPDDLEPEDRELFRQKLVEAFEFIMDSPFVEFSDEQKDDPL